MKLAGTMLRTPLSLAKMSYDAATGTVIYRSKMHLGLKRNFQVMPGAEWLTLLCKHIPDRYEHLVRYCDWYSNRSGGGGVEARLIGGYPATILYPWAKTEPIERAQGRSQVANRKDC